MSSVAPVQQPVRRPEARAVTSWNRWLHRVGGLFGALLMLWIAGTGIMMQSIDLKAIFTHEPQTTPTQLSIQEGMYGPPNYAVIQLSDFTAPAFPEGFNIRNGVATVLQAAHVYQGQGAEPGFGTGAARTGRDLEDRTGGPANGGPRNGSPRNGEPSGGRQGAGNPQLNPMAWVELRMSNGVPIGQLMMGTRLEAFNALTGAPVPSVPPVALPQGRALPPSLRQKLKTLHRFWNRGDTPGVYVEFLAGLFLMMLTVTGLVMYFRLLGTRVRQGRRSPLWLKGGGWWRGLHRVVSVLAAAFIFLIAFSGTWIGFESSYGPIKRVFAGAPQPPGAGQRAQAGLTGPGGGGRGLRNPIDFIIPLRDAEVQDMTATTLTSMQALHPEESIKAIRLRIFGQVKQGAVISTDGKTTNQYIFDADTGALDSLTEQGYPMSNFPFGVQVHENIKHFHSGAMFGVPTRVMNLLSGMSLTFLSVSGLVMYFDMWLKRRKSGRMNLFWA